ncbi:MAG: glutamyl-tRNA amidotransferase [Lachnospiraceae bacterium]|nr:glutamyl-tRNA amidotransferase [Lachnospiraceae bacterium]MBR1844119.1 glutamyl-tRNA amidotransferase [Lachnospiraceae bacterium]
MGEGNKKIILAVNGTLMRGLELEKNMLDAGASLLCEAKTEKAYRLYSIDDKNPAMIRVPVDSNDANEIDVELWEVPYEGLVSILMKEPEGLSVGKVKLNDGRVVLGVIGESELIKDKKEITKYGGWRNYIKTL